MDSRILSINKIEEPQDEDITEEKTKKKKETDDWYLGLNLKLRWLNQVLSKHNFNISDRTTWDTSSFEYQVDMMKLLLVHLNKMYNKAAKHLTFDIADYEN